MNKYTLTSLYSEEKVDCCKLRKENLGNSLAVQGLCTFTAEGPGSITGWGTNIPLAVRLKKGKRESGSPVGLNSMRFSCSLPWCMEFCDVNQLE